MGLGATPASEPSPQLASMPPGSVVGPPLSVGVEQDGATLTLRLTGEFDLAGVGSVEAALERAAAPTRRVVFDLRGLSFLDLAGLKMILRADERSRSAPFDVVIVRPRGLVAPIFTLTGAGERLTLVDEPPQRQGQG